MFCSMVYHLEANTCGVMVMSCEVSMRFVRSMVSFPVLKKALRLRTVTFFSAGSQMKYMPYILARLRMYSAGVYLLCRSRSLVIYEPLRRMLVVV